jgi:hypothetical protein
MIDSLFQGTFRVVSARIVILTVALIGVAMSAEPASADWDYTKWGMTVDDVIFAGKGKVNRLNDEQTKDESTFYLACRAQSLLPVTIGGIVFNKVNFCFDTNGKLASVDLYAEESEFYAVDRALASTFGAPARASDDGIPERIYSDKNKGNSLRLVLISSTILTYTPIPSGF